jgi:hypothetical protein
MEFFFRFFQFFSFFGQYFAVFSTNYYNIDYWRKKMTKKRTLLTAGIFTVLTAFLGCEFPPSISSELINELAEEEIESADEEADQETDQDTDETGENPVDSRSIINDYMAQREESAKMQDHSETVAQTVIVEDGGVQIDEEVLFSQHIYTPTPVSISLLPGELYYLDDLNAGYHTPLTLDRGPVEMYLVNGVSGKSTQHLDTWTPANANSATMMLLENNKDSVTASVNFKMKRIHSFEHAAAEAGLGGHYADVISAGYSFSEGNTSVKSRFIIEFSSVWFEIKVSDSATLGDMVDTETVDMEDLKQAKVLERGVVRVDSILYGAKAYLFIESEVDASSTGSALEAAVNIGVGGGSGSSAAPSETLKKLNPTPVPPKG